MSTEAIFETMRASAGTVALLDRHLTRLLRSAAALGLDAPSEAELRQLVQERIADLDAARVRLVLGPDGVTVQAGPLPAMAAVRLASVVTDPGPEWVHKLLERAGYAAAQARAHETGADHALLVSPDGRLLEADHANLLVCVDGVIVTPPVAGVLPGVARQALLDAGLAREGLVMRSEIHAHSEVALVNALRGLISVTHLDGTPVPPPSAALSAAGTWLQTRLGR